MIFKSKKEQCEKLIKLCTLEDKEFTERMKKKNNNGFFRKYINLYHEKDGRFHFSPALVSEFLENTKEKIDVKYLGEMRQEQKTILSKIKKNNLRSGLVEMKTGRGKTHLIMQIIGLLKEKTLICVHNTSGLTQTKESIKEFLGCDVGLYYSKEKEIKDITITTHASLKAKKEMFENKFGLLIIDEADINVSKKMVEAITTIDCDAIFGLTGTPNRKDIGKIGLELLYGKHIKLNEQENNGYNFLPKITQLNHYNNDTFSFENYQELKDLLIENEKRKNAQINFVLNQYRKGESNFGLLLFERKEKECRKMYKEFKKYENEIGYLGLVDGSTNTKKDEETIRKMKEKGKGLIIGTASKVGRGKDISCLDSVFLFFPNKFRSSTVQAVGRGLRFDGKKNECNVYDRCDLPILIGQKKERLRTYKTEYPGCEIRETTVK